MSCNEIQTLPSQVGQLEALRDLNIRRNHLVRLPPGTHSQYLCVLIPVCIRTCMCVLIPVCVYLYCVELAELPLVRLDFSCNKVTSIPVCYRQLTQLQTIVLDNNPLQTPPAQVHTGSDIISVQSECKHQLNVCVFCADLYQREGPHI